MKERQVSFAGGVLSPTLHGRTDLDRYGVGARTLTNFFITQHGVLQNRSGSQFVANTAKPGVQFRVVPFIISETEGYILTLKADSSTVEVYREKTDNTRHEFEQLATFTATSYSASDLNEIQIAQVGNVMHLVHRSYRDRYITHVDSTTWSSTTTKPNEGATATIPQFPGLFDMPHSQFPRITQWVAPVTGDDLAGDANHPAREWTYIITYLMRSSDDNSVYETLGFEVTDYYETNVLPADSALGRTEAETNPGLSIQTNPAPNAKPGRIAVYPDWVQTIWLGAEKGDTISMDLVSGARIDTHVSTRVYRGRQGRFGFVGESEGFFFEDDGITPDFQNPPPEGDNPYNTTNAFASAIAFFEERRYMGGPNLEPGLVRGSAIDQYFNYDEVSFPDDSDALKFKLASNIRENVQAIVPHRKLLVFTNSKEWVVTGSGENDPITPNAIQLRSLGTDKGSAYLQPVVINGEVFFVQAKGVVPRALSFDERGMPRAADVSLLSRHLFDGFSIKDWAYAEDPHSILWVVRSDGALLSMTYIPEQGMLGWAKHEISGDGLVESVGTKPEGNEDAVYLCVNRDGTRSLERLAYRSLPRLSDGEDDVRYGIFLDSSVTYSEPNDTIDLTLTGIDRAIGSVSHLIPPSTFVSQTTEANNATVADWDVHGAGASAGYIAFLADASRFGAVAFVNAGGTPGVVSGDFTAVWEYPNVDGDWVALENVVDGTQNFTSLSSNQVLTFDMPADWGVTGSDDDYFIRHRVVTGSYTTDPVYDQGFIRATGLIGETIKATFGSSYTGNVGQVIQIDNPTQGLEPVRIVLTVENTTTDFDAQVLDVIDVPSTVFEVLQDFWWVCSETIGGLGHLEGEFISALVDGDVITDRKVKSGVIDVSSFSLPGGAAIAHAGLPFNADFESLDAVQEHGKQKVVKEIWVEIEGTRGGSVGSSLDSLVEMPARDVSGGYAALVSKRREERLIVQDSWGKKGRIAFRQSDPLPVSLLALMRDLDYGVL